MNGLHDIYIMISYHAVLNVIVHIKYFKYFLAYRDFIAVAHIKRKLYITLLL